MSWENLYRGMMVILSLCAITVTVLVVKRFAFASDGAPPKAPSVAEDWRTYALDSSRLGPRNAPVTITTFSDYQCPFCRVMAPTIKSARDRDTLRIALVDRHSPIESMHPFAFEAAVAAECARDQEQFEPMHLALYAREDLVVRKDWGAVAAQAGVADTTALMQCVVTQATSPRVRRDIADARRLGVTGTPTILINQVRLNGIVPPATLDSIIASLQ